MAYMHYTYPTLLQKERHSEAHCTEQAKHTRGPAVRNTVLILLSRRTRIRARTARRPSRTAARRTGAIGRTAAPSCRSPISTPAPTASIHAQLLRQCRQQSIQRAQILTQPLLPIILTLGPIRAARVRVVVVAAGALGARGLGGSVENDAPAAVAGRGGCGAQALSGGDGARKDAAKGDFVDVAGVGREAGGLGEDVALHEDGRCFGEDFGEGRRVVDGRALGWGVRGVMWMDGNKGWDLRR